MNSLFDRRDIHAHAVRRAQRAYAWLNHDRGGNQDGVNALLVGHLMHTEPDTIRRACERLGGHRQETPE